MRFIFSLFIAIVFSISFSSCVTTVRATPTRVVVVKKLPKHHRIVYVKGHRYYKWNGHYYKKTTRGYVVVRI